jgi:hypothetical protein
VEALTRKALGTHDPLSLDVSGGFLEGNLVTLRRERSHDRNNIFYLLLAWRHDGTEWREVEEEACTVSRQLSYLDFNAIYKLRDILAKTGSFAKLQALWGGSLDSVTDLARRSDGSVRHPTGAPKKRECTGWLPNCACSFPSCSHTC